MRQLVYTHVAQSDLVSIALYIARESGHRKLAVQFTDRLRDKCRQLAALPGTLGQARPELRADIRSIPFQGYVIFFRYLSKTRIEIVTIVHASRDIDHYFETL